MIFRLAKLKDINRLASIHYECSKKQTGGFMYKLGLLFFKIYYKILLNEKNSIVLVATDQDGKINGFTSGTLKAEEHLNALKNNKFKLAFSILPVLIKRPYLLKSVIQRNNFINSQNSEIKFGITFGPRIEYWAWDPKNKENMAMPMFKTWLNILFSMGIQSVKGEIDIENKGLYLVHKVMGAKIVNELKLEDSRHRVIIEYENKLSKNTVQNNII